MGEEKPAGRLLSIRVVFVWGNTTTFKDKTRGGGGGGGGGGGFQNLSAGFLFACWSCEATAPQESAAYCFH